MPENKNKYHFIQGDVLYYEVIDAAALDYKTLNEVLRQPEHDYVIEGCCGQRFIGAGMSDRNITVNGISGNALGAT